MGSNKSGSGADFEQLARQYWNAWSQFAPGSEPGAAMPGWKDGLAWWTQLAGQGRDDVESALERMNAQAGSWFGAMQQLAGSFAGRDASAGDIADAWRRMLEGADGNPLAQMFHRMSGADAKGVDAWLAQVAPFLGMLRGEGSSWLNLPAFGLAREHQGRLQRLARAQLDYQERSSDYHALLAQAGKRAFERFESKLAERSEPGRQIESARALFDLWIDAAEEAWTEIALTPDYRRIYGAMVNAQMRLRAGVQHEIELLAGQLGLPTRSEVNASHRKVAALERELRALRAELAQRAAPAPARAAAAPAPATPKAARVPRVETTKAKRAQRAAAPKRGAARKAVLPQVDAPRAARAAPTRKPAANATRRKAR
jgi:class III poly(R)-hydroxyalkanoic acid synthase PhaE subunit